MRDQFPFLGIPTPERRALTRELLRDAGAPSPTALEKTARACWNLPEREYQYFAGDYVSRYVRTCPPAFLSTIRWLVTHKSWWDTVDVLSQCAGALVRAHPELASEMDVWIDDPDFWIARVAILHQLRYKSETDETRLFDYCARRSTDTEFFIRKAIGWALRQYARTDMAAVKEFVASHPELSPLSVREALKHA